MESFFILVLIAILLVRWLVQRNRLMELQRRIDYLESNPHEARLTQRIYALERALEDLQRTRPAREEAKGPEPAAQEEAPVAMAPLRVSSEPAAAPPPLPEPEAVLSQLLPAEPAALPEVLVVPDAPTPTLAQRLRERVPGEEWEAIVGGSWLNKLGVFVLVIGIALFLGYSFTRLGPAGRVAIGLAVSFAMLASGVVFERRARYTAFSRGLLGGGWGALYFTTYAMYAVSATKVIDNAVAASALVLAVAAGMIAHSLRYRSQTVTGLAYLIGFATLSPAIAPTAALSVVALVPLAGSLLFVVRRFGWSPLALMGVIATYGTCVSRGDSGAPLWQAQAVFAAYWLLFETFDVLRAKDRTAYTAWERLIFPLNAAGFLVLSYAKWSHAEPDRLYALAAGVAALYLASTLLRAYVRPPSSFALEAPVFDRVFGGGYEGPVTVAAGLGLTAILLKWSGATAEWAVMGLAELIFAAGLMLRQSYLRNLGSVVFAGAVKLLADDIHDGNPTTVAGWPIKSWTPLIAAEAALFYVNRTLSSTDTFFGYLASGLVALILGFNAPEAYRGPAWLALASVLFAFGWARRSKDFRIQSYLASALALGSIAVRQVLVASGDVPALPHGWLALLGAFLCSYAGAVCGLRSAADRLTEWERSALLRFGSWAASLALVMLAWRVLPGEYLGLGWMAASLPLLELGLHSAPQEFRRQAHAVALLGALRVLAFNLLPIENTGPLAPRIAIAGAALIAYFFALRIHTARKAAVPTREARIVFNVSSAAGTVFVMAASWALLPSIVVAPAWAAVSLLLVELGLGLDLPFLRMQGHIAGAASFTRLFFANFTGFGSTGFVSHRILTVAPVMLSEYYQFSQLKAASSLNEWERSAVRMYLYAAVVLGVVLMRFELGRVLTVMGWAAFALVLLIAGRRWNNIDLRWQSYALAALCFWRSWITNFYAPESFAGVSGRIWTGAFVIACFYAARLMLPGTVWPRQASTDGPGAERHAGLYYSLLASVLFAVLLYYEVSGGVLTVAWGAEGIALLAAGFPLKDRVFRLSGLSLFLICVLKLFLYDLRHLETMYRILSFIALGSMLVCVSWVYTRFRDRVQRFL